MAKEKKAPTSRRPITVRHEHSAGGLVGRRNPKSGAIEVALVRPAGRDAWALPKGLVEKGESAADTAVREVAEETGLKVRIGASLGPVSYVYSWHDTSDGPLVRIFKRVDFFLMEQVGGDVAGHDEEIEEVAWFAIDDAIKKASYHGERDIIAKARALLLENGSDGSSPPV